MRVLILRPEPQASEMARVLNDAGIETEIEPLLTIRPERDVAARVLAGPRPLALLVTSRNGVSALCREGIADEMLTIPLIAVGPATGAAARQAGFRDVTVGNGDADGVVAAVRRRFSPPEGQLVLVAGEDRSGDIDLKLAEHGFAIDIIVAYRAERRDCLDSDKIAALMTGKIDAVVVASARTSASLAAALDAGGVKGRLERPVLVAISAAAAQPVAACFARVRIARRPDGDALIEAVRGLI